MTSLTKFLTLLCVLFSTAGNGLLAFKTNTGKQIVRKEGLCDGDYDNEYRLPGNVKPTHYDLTLRPDLEQFTFDGEASIRVNIQGDSVRQITIHQLDLSIHQASFITQDKEIKVIKRDYSVKLQTMTYTFEKPLPRDGQLKFKYSGILSDVLQGFYRSKYTLKDGTVSYLATTQFESTYARRAFPSFDEPALKATFSITLIVPKKLTALSNMPEMSSNTYQEDSSLRVVKYETTPKMSTYLVAFVIGEFDSVQGKTKSGTPVRVLTPKGKRNQGKFALNIGIRSLNYYTTYLNTPYTLPKMDMVVIPDFSAGAMENWGLITYKENALLVSKDSSLEDKQKIAITVAHELAHQYFGDLVTTKWWSQIWLNEGFAQFFCYDSVSNIYPEWKFWNKFHIDDYAKALNFDAFYNSHPVEVPTPNRDSIFETFDAIAYGKGSSLLSMLRDWIGDDSFRNGLHLYLGLYNYSNTCTVDLFEAFDETSSLPVSSVMSKWTKQKGFPLLTVSKKKKPGKTPCFKLSQAKFAANANLTVQERKSKWDIVLKYSIQSDRRDYTRNITISKRSQSLKAPRQSSKGWIKLNTKSIGFYRVQYSDSLLKRFLPDIRSQKLGSVNRLQIQSDLLALVRAGYQSTPKFLEFVKAYQKDTCYFAWFSVSESLSAINSLLAYTDYNDQFKAYGLEMFSEIAKETTWDEKPDEGPQTTLLRSLVLTNLGRYDNEDVILESKRRFKLFRENGAAINPNIRIVIYSNVVSNGSDSEIDIFLDMYKQAKNVAERDRIGKALTSASTKTQIRKVLEFSLSSNVRSQDYPAILIALGDSKLGRELAWQFFKDNKEKLQYDYSSDQQLGKIILGITQKFASEEKAQEVEQFFRKNYFSGSDRSVKRAVESIRLNAKWLSRDRAGIKNYLMQAF